MSADVTDTVMQWESTGFPNGKMKPPITARNSFSPKLRYMTRQLLKTRPRNFTLKIQKIYLFLTNQIYGQEISTLILL